MSTKKIPSNLIKKLYQKKNSELNDPLHYYLHLGRQGQYPLFFKEWIENYKMQAPEKKHDEKSLRSIFQKIEHHHNIDRQKIALSSLSQEERSKFIQAFMGGVENEILNQRYSLH